MAIKEIIEIVKAPEVREDAWWITYIETEGERFSWLSKEATVKVAVKGDSEEEAKATLYREYEKHYGDSKEKTNGN